MDRSKLKHAMPKGQRIRCATKWGCDPELFFTDDNGDIVPASTIVPQDEDKALTFHKDGDPGGNDAQIFADGLAVEFKARARVCRAYLGDNIHQALRQINMIAEENGVNMTPVSSVSVPKDTLESLDHEDRRLGCDPAKIAWIDGNVSDMANDPWAEYRGAGGHIHIGASCEKDYEVGNNRFTSRGKDKARYEVAHRLRDEEDRIGLVKVFDTFVAAPMVLLDQGRGSARRRQMYGLAGSYRSTPYGLEYRTLSNFWIRDSRLYFFITEYMRDLIGLYMTKQLDEFMNGVDPDLIISTIHDNDPKKAMRVIEMISPVLDRVDHGENNMVDIANELEGGFQEFFHHLVSEKFADKDEVNPQSWNLDRKKVGHSESLLDFSDIVGDFRSRLRNGERFEEALIE